LLDDRLRPMRGLKTVSSLRVIAAGHAFVQNLRRSHYEITVECPSKIAFGSRSAISRLASDSRHAR
jgi:hypothetical protein